MSILFIVQRAIHISLAEPEIAVAQHLDRVVAETDRGRAFGRASGHAAASAYTAWVGDVGIGSQHRGSCHQGIRAWFGARDPAAVASGAVGHEHQPLHGIDAERIHTADIGFLWIVLSQPAARNVSRARIVPAGTQRVFLCIGQTFPPPHLYSFIL